MHQFWFVFHLWIFDRCHARCPPIFLPPRRRNGFAISQSQNEHMSPSPMWPTKIFAVLSTSAKLLQSTSSKAPLTGLRTLAILISWDDLAALPAFLLLTLKPSTDAPHPLLLLQLRALALVSPLLQRNAPKLNHPSRRLLTLPAQAAGPKREMRTQQSWRKIIKIENCKKALKESKSLSFAIAKFCVCMRFPDFKKMLPTISKGSWNQLPRPAGWRNISSRKVSEKTSKSHQNLSNLYQCHHNFASKSSIFASQGNLQSHATLPTMKRYRSLPSGACLKTGWFNKCNFFTKSTSKCMKSIKICVCNH